MLLNLSDSVLFYSQQTREANNTVRSTIKLRSNTTRRMANKTGVVSLRVQRLYGAFYMPENSCFLQEIFSPIKIPLEKNLSWELFFALG